MSISSTAQNPASLDDGADMRALLSQSLATLLGRLYSFEQRNVGRSVTGRGVDGAWQAYADLGLLALGLPEAHGGFPGGLADIAMAAELMGGAMTLEPYLPTMLAARMIAAAGTAEQQAAWLPGIVSGKVHAAIAHREGGGRLGHPVETMANPEGTGWRLNGRKSVVAGGDEADIFIVSALLDGEVELFLVPAADVRRRSYRCFDWTGAANLDLDGTVVSCAMRIPGGERVLARALDESVALACAEAVGAIRAANRLVREHTGTRRQFGRSLDSFQVLQHRMVDMAIAEELAAPIAQASITACETATADARAQAVSAAQVKVGDAARLVGQQCVQLHGGMGLTQEYPASHLFARLGLFERLHGNRDEHLERYAALMVRTLEEKVGQ
ncbi:pimeloyl-CoA dehydrogenase small subunit [Sphingomonas sp. So64.6b]|uniref:acyl-CoA dehydrogenase family protein n=1 Tax=Sphingomonas sp. So64.6b TaxID=2997354 RepID=UPI0016016479|nr:acyl-CoA dehydrogenase family protein [Sphingomonas sp. So64.6b]QNA86549.1 pimeloyl-CoA dehydrogenase small subunit [Sphingomonas sp. So64.6b]